MVAAALYALYYQQFFAWQKGQHAQPTFPPTPDPVVVAPPAPVPEALPPVSAVLTAALNTAVSPPVLTLYYRGVALASGDPSLVTAITKVSPTRLDFTLSGPCDLPMLTMPVPPTNIGPADPIVGSTDTGPAIATYIGDGFTLTAASTDPDVSVHQRHAAEADTHPEFRAIGIDTLQTTPRTLTLSICVDDESLAPFNAAFVATHPQSLKWLDRRPIVMLVLNDNDTRAFPQIISDTIAFCQRLDAQGCIFWNLDRDKLLAYEGNPDNITNEQPTYDLGFLRDQFAAAKLRFGFCVRPWQVDILPGDVPVVNPAVDGIAALMHDLAFCESAGGTLAYTDSVPIDSAQWLVDAQGVFKAMLISPERGNVAMLAAGAPLREAANGALSLLESPYPTEPSGNAFQCILHPAGLTDAQLAAVLAAGHVLLVEPWDDPTAKRLGK